MSLRIPTPDSGKRPHSFELAVPRKDGLHDAALHAEILGADDKRIIWIRPAGRIRVPS